MSTAVERTNSTSRSALVQRAGLEQSGSCQGMHQRVVLEQSFVVMQLDDLQRLQAFADVYLLDELERRGHVIDSIIEKLDLVKVILERMIAKQLTLRALNAALIVEALKRSDGEQKKAGKFLGISPRMMTYYCRGYKGRNLGILPKEKHDGLGD